MPRPKIKYLITVHTQAGTTVDTVHGAQSLATYLGFSPKHVATMMRSHRKDGWHMLVVLPGDYRRLHVFVQVANV